MPPWKEVRKPGRKRLERWGARCYSLENGWLTLRRSENSHVEAEAKKERIGSR